MAGAPKILDLPIGLDATGMRTEFDGLGKAEADVLDSSLSVTACLICFSHFT